MLNMRSNIIEEFTGQNKKLLTWLFPPFLPPTCQVFSSAFTSQISDVYFHTPGNPTASALLWQRVLDGSVDLALVGNTFDEPDCCFIPFCKDKLVIATPVNQHYLQYQQKMDSGTLDFSDFLREPFIMRETGSGTKRNWPLSGKTKYPGFFSAHCSPHERSGGHPQICSRRPWNLHPLYLLCQIWPTHTHQILMFPFEPRIRHANLLHCVQ